MKQVAYDGKIFSIFARFTTAWKFLRAQPILSGRLAVNAARLSGSIPSFIGSPRGPSRRELAIDFKLSLAAPR